MPNKEAPSPNHLPSSWPPAKSTSPTVELELIKTDDREMTLIVWPRRPTPVSARKLSETVATVCRVLSNAVIELAARRRYR